MRLNVALVLAFVGLLVCPAFSIPNHAISESVDKKPGKRVTLLVRTDAAKRDNWKKAIVSFLPTEIYGEWRERQRSDDMYAGPVEKNAWDLLYGALNYNGDRDWLQVNCDRNSWSRIRDLGELDWSDDINVPVLPILPCRANEPCGRIHVPARNSGKKIHDEELNPHIAKPIVGHMYVVHRHKQRRLNDQQDVQALHDYYALVRVEELKPNESCTITWKRISAPKN